MPVLILIVALAIVTITVYAAIGRGGELSAEQPDYAPLDLGPVSATDVVLLRPPAAMWGYSQEATDEALERIAESIRERDVRIVALEQLVTDLSRDTDPALPPRAYVGQRRRISDDEFDRVESAPARPALSGPAQGQPPLNPSELASQPEAVQDEAAQDEAADHGLAQHELGQIWAAPSQDWSRLPWEPARGKPEAAQDEAAQDEAAHPGSGQPGDSGERSGQQQSPPERSHG